MFHVSFRVDCVFEIWHDLIKDYKIVYLVYKYFVQNLDASFIG